MKYRIGIILLGAFVLVACGLGLNPGPAPTVQVPPTPSTGGEQIPIDAKLPDFQLGRSGTGCGTIAADMTGQSVSGTLTVFPRAGQNELRAVASNGRYSGNAALLNGSCQPTGQQYNLAATFGLDYSATLGNVGNARCIQNSQLVVTSLALQGLPGPITAIVQPLVINELPRLMSPRIDDLVVRRFNGGSLPAGGAHCSGS